MVQRVNIAIEHRCQLIERRSVGAAMLIRIAIIAKAPLMTKRLHTAYYVQVIDRSCI